MMSKRVEIIQTAVGYVWGPGRNPLEGASPEEVVSFFEKHKAALADPVIGVFNEVYPTGKPDDQIPEEDVQLFQDAWDSRAS